MKTLRDYINLVEAIEFRPADPKPLNNNPDMELSEEELEEISRRDFLKGAGALAVGATGLIPGIAKADFTFGLPTKTVFRGCVPAGMQVGQKIRNRETKEIFVIKKIEGKSSNCENSAILEPYSTEISVTQPQNQNLNLSYGEKIGKLIQQYIVFNSNNITDTPVCQFQISVSPEGKITDIKLIQRSSLPEWDNAVYKAINRVSTIPADENGTVPQTFNLTFAPK